MAMSAFFERDMEERLWRMLSTVFSGDRQRHLGSQAAPQTG